MASGIADLSPADRLPTQSTFPAPKQCNTSRQRTKSVRLNGRKNHNSLFVIRFIKLAWMLQLAGLVARIVTIGPGGIVSRITGENDEQDFRS